MLPPASFADPAVLAWEIEHLYGGWVCLGHASLVAEPGSYLMREIGETSVFALADEDGAPRVFLNTCRHRGLPARRGDRRARSAGASSAPTTPGPTASTASLAAAPHMDAVEDFDRSCFGLIEVRSAVVSGLLPGRPERRGGRPGRARRRPGPHASRAGSSRTFGVPARAHTRSRRTGRRSARTTTSASTARASTRS